MIAESAVVVQPKTQINSADLPTILDSYAETEILSLDCFDTLLWRQTAAPKDVFTRLQQKPLFQSLGVTAHQRLSAAARTYREKYIAHGNHQILLKDIYARFTALTTEQQNALMEEEIATEIELCYPFKPMVDLIRQAHALGKKIIIVSDIYFTEPQLRRLLSETLPHDVMQMISHVFASTEHSTSKSENLFKIVMDKLHRPAASILHIGDHHTADFVSPTRFGLKALHFIQFNDTVNQFLKKQHDIGSLASLAHPITTNKNLVRYSAFRHVFSVLPPVTNKPEHTIGYLTFGPIFYTFAKFVCDEIAAIKKSGKNPKIFFLLRDAYLLSKACEAYAGHPVGKLVRIRKFVTVAASFRTKADVDHYISSIKPEHFNFWVILEQLLLPKPIVDNIMQITFSASNQEQTFYQLLHRPEILDEIFKQSAAYRARLARYIQKEMQLEPGDTAVLVDTGYMGVTQEFLTRGLAEEFDVSFKGLYFIGSHEPDRPDCKSLFTSTWCEHGLLEQTCTYKEGCVIDYDMDGNPIFDKIKLSDQQYDKVKTLQDECLRFIHEAKDFINEQNLPFEMLRETAFTALHRHIFFPTDAEIAYFQTYQHDKDLGPTGSKTMFNLANGLDTLQKSNSLTKLHPYEARTIHLNLTLSSLLQRSFDLDLTNETGSLQAEPVKLIVMNGAHMTEVNLYAMQTYNGYFAFVTPPMTNEKIAIVFGAHYEWLQIHSIQVMGNNTQPNISISLDNMTENKGNLFQCKDNGILCLTAAGPTASCKIIFRPIVKRTT